MPIGSQETLWDAELRNAIFLSFEGERSYSLHRNSGIL
jgi:hypothetical protein